MNHCKRLAISAVGLASLVGVAPVATADAGPSTIVPVSCALAQDPAPEPVRIEAPGFGLHFGGGTLDGGAPTACGRLVWDLSDPGTITPRLTGTLFAKNAAGASVRVVMRHSDVHGTELGVTRGRSKYVSSDEETFPIDIGNFASPSIYHVDIELQQLAGGTNGSWTAIASSSHHLGSATLADDGILLDGGSQSFGVRPYVDRAPSGPGTLSWELTDLGIVPHLTGDLFLRNSAYTPTRLRMSYFNVHGRRMSAATCAYETEHNGVVRLPVDCAGPANPYLYAVEVQIEVGTYADPLPVGDPVRVTI